MKEEKKLSNAPGFWKEHSLAWKTSGLTQRDYCEQEGISLRSFVYQNSRLKKEVKPALMPFIKATPEAPPLNSHTARVELILPI